MSHSNDRFRAAGSQAQVYREGGAAMEMQPTHSSGSDGTQYEVSPFEDPRDRSTTYTNDARHVNYGSDLSSATNNERYGVPNSRIVSAEADPLSGVHAMDPFAESYGVEDDYYEASRGGTSYPLSDVHSAQHSTTHTQSRTSVHGADLYDEPQHFTGSQIYADSYTDARTYTNSQVSLSYPTASCEKLPLEDEEAPLTYAASAASGVSLGRSQTTTEAWKARQKLNPSRAARKSVKLQRGRTFVADYAVPTPVRTANENAMRSGLFEAGEPREFSHMRYTAASCDPDDFTRANGFSLRPAVYGRGTDLVICITAYNEDKILLTRTLHGVMQNIRDMVRGEFSEFGREKDEESVMGDSGRPASESGQPANATRASGRKSPATGNPKWKKIVVCLIFDGLDVANKNALDVLATLGVYQDGVMQKSVNGRPTVAHIFEYTTLLSMSAKPALVEPRADANCMAPVQMILCIKQDNSKKINSHRWLFNAVCGQLQPDVVTLLDAGTKPGRRAIYYMWEAFHHNARLGGACGEIHTMLGRHARKLLNPLVAAQNFEYKMSNILDKPLESAFGYVSVLPGAFSSYRYRAIVGRPLHQYFHGDHTLAARLGPKGVDGMNIWMKNMFLAEDRILCFELVAKAGERWVLGYVKPSKAETDVPETAAELISQRRRWLNGSFAAGVYSLVHFGRLYRSSHSILRLLFLHLQALYNTVSLIMSWFAVGNFYLTFSIIIDLIAANLVHPKEIPGADDAVIKCWTNSVLEQASDDDSTSWLQYVNLVFKVLYLMLLGYQVILALGNRPRAERVAYTVSITTFAFFSIYLTVNTVILTVMAFCPLSSLLKDSSNAVSVFMGQQYGPIFAGLFGTVGVYVLASVLYLDVGHLFHSMPQFLLIAPSFTNILNVYAFCNLHDVSWGTKGSDTVSALPSAKAKVDTGKEVTVEVAAPIQEDIDISFRETVLRAIEPVKEIEEVSKPSADDQNKTFRTRFISVWFFCNTLLVLIVSALPTKARTRYFQVILFITFGLSLTRFCGLLYFLTGAYLFRIMRGFSRLGKKY